MRRIITTFTLLFIVSLSYKTNAGTFHCEQDGQKRYSIKQRIDVDWVEASFPVGFAQQVIGNDHYIAYYDKDKNLTVAHRKLDETTWSKTRLNSRIGWDSHNYIAMIVDDEGYIHVSGNMHAVPLKYWRSRYPKDISEFIDIHTMTGVEEQRTTYPQFLRRNDGLLLFHYRTGGSGNGSEIYNQWNPKTQKWTRFLEQQLISGEGLRNAYMRGPVPGPDGYYHLIWVWRNTPDCSTNNTFSYAKSRDLLNWTGVEGTPIQRPMLFSHKELIVDPAPVKTGMLNGVQRLAFDSKKQVVLVNMKYDDHGNSQLYAYRYQKGYWKSECITKWDYRFEFSGIGSIVFNIRLNELRNLGNGKLGISYYHAQYGIGEIVFDEVTLKPIEVRPFVPDYPAELDLVTTRFGKPIGVRINKSGNYILRWETMEANNDKKPSDPLPPYYMLEMIEIEEIE